MNNQHLLDRTKALKLYGLIDHWSDINKADWLPPLLQWEEKARTQRSLERRVHQAKLPPFKSIEQFDWSWPEKCDQALIMNCMQADFMSECINIILCGPNGVGKSTLACNIMQQTILQGHTAIFTTAGHMLNELASQESDQALKRRLRYYTQPALLCIDELGYLSYSHRHADLLFEIISRRYQNKSTMVTTNKPFAEWTDIFPNAACVVSMIDRLVHQSEIITIEAKSYRLKEAKEKSAKRLSKNNKQK